MKLLLLAPVLLVFIHLLNTYGKLRKVRLQITHAWGVLRPWLNQKFTIMLKILALMSEYMPEEEHMVEQTVKLVKKGLNSKYIKEKLEMELQAENKFKAAVARFSSRGGQVARGFMHYYEQYKEACTSLDNAANSYNRIAEFYNREAREFPASVVSRLSKNADYPTRQKRYNYN